MSTEKALPPTNLSSAFAKPSRSAGLRLPTKKPSAKPTTPRPAPIAAAPAPEATLAPVEPQKATDDTSGPETSKAPAAAKKSTPKPLVLWTPLSIRSRMQATRNATGSNYLDLVLDALEAQVDALPNLIAEATGQRHVKGRLFERATPTPTASATKPQRVQLTIPGVLPSQFEVIDQLVESMGAGSRSALCNAALDANLPPD